MFHRHNSAASSLDDANVEDEDVLKALAASLEDVKRPALLSDDKNLEKEQEPEVPKSTKPVYPVLPDEPKCDSHLLCKILVRLPDGQRFRRNFLRTDSIQVYHPKLILNLSEMGFKDLHFLL